MKKKYLLTALAVGLCMTANVMAQVPSYIPTSGLVGWWPFNGNANDESGNGNNGTVNGAALTADRNGNANKAYSFNGTNNYINVNSSISLNTYNMNALSISGWFKANTSLSGFIIRLGNPDATTGGIGYEVFNYNNGNNNLLYVQNWWMNQSPIYSESTPISLNQWYFFSITFDFLNNISSFYVNGSLISTSTAVLHKSNNPILNIGRNTNGGSGNYFNGLIDDIGIWNRALTSQEIAVLYNGCSASPITSQPVNSVINVGSNAQFTVNAAAGSTYQWQSNPANFGWQNVPSNASYSGASNNTLNVSNTTVSNHNQPFRAIVNAGGCIDTSDVAQIIIGDTCLTTVTDTLIINTTLGLPAPNNENTILIYPNPASDHITIDNGNFTAMTGYSLKITNNAGQQVFQSAINQAQFYVDLSTWSGDGLYFVHLIDPQNNTVTVRKIVLQ